MARSAFLSPLTFLGSQRPLARYFGRPVARFLAIEAAGGILLLVATAVALIWANTDEASYLRFLHAEVVVGFGDFEIAEGHFDVHALVNDALMAVFFFVVGLEIKRELVVGELRDPRVAALPAVAALGGMVVPAGLFLALNSSGDGSAGWGIPMATDIAFAVAVVALLGTRVPASLKLFLLTLAIVDDIGAILVIALFYTDSLSFGWLALAGVGLAVMVGLRALKVWYIPLYWIVGIFVWLAVLESGVHATIAGVVMGLLTPARPLQSEFQADAVVDTLEGSDISVADVRVASFHIRESVSVAERLEDALHPWSSFLIVPIFALVNAGIVLNGESVEAALSSSVTWGIVLGLVVGKTVGITAFSLGAVKLGLCQLPGRVRPSHLLGASAIAGIGFTVSLFITDLAFDDPALAEEAKFGILLASVAAAVAGAIVLSVGGRPPVDEDPASIDGQPIDLDAD